MYPPRTRSLFEKLLTPKANEYPFDEYFFHYTTADAAFGDILPRERIRLSPYGKMKDPLEYKAFFRLPNTISLLSAEEEKREAAIRVQRESSMLAGRLRQETKVLALTLDARGYEGLAAPFGRGWARTRMWERYAEDHAGVCLIFHRDKLEQRIRTRLSGKRGTVFFGDVDYTQMGLAGEPGAQSLKLDREAEGLTTEALAKHLTEHHRKLFFLKTLDWQTENEYRFVAITPGRGYEYVPFGDALAAVVVGEKFPTWQVAGALETCKQAKVDALALGWFDYRPRIRDLVVPKRVRKLPRARSKTPQKEDPPRPPSP